MTKRIYEKDDVTSATSALDAYGQSVKQGFSSLIYDEYGNLKTEFRAQVLSRPILLTGRELGRGQDAGSKFMYRARIHHSRSPHEWLPDPCDPTTALSEDMVLKVIDAHTTFISNTDLAHLGYDIPKIGDYVNVKLEPGENSYDLQYGTHLNIEDEDNATVRDPATNKSRQQKLCEPLTKLFGSGAVPFLGEYLPDTGGISVGTGPSPAAEIGKQEAIARAKRCRGADHLGPAAVTNLGAHLGLAGMKEGKQKDLCCGSDKIINVSSSATSIWTWNWLAKQAQKVEIDHTADDDDYIQALGTVAARNPEFLCIAQLRVVEKYAKLCDIQSIGAREIHRRQAIADPRLIEGHQRKEGDQYGPMADKVRLRSGWSWTPDCDHRLCRKFGSSTILARKLYKCAPWWGVAARYSEEDRKREMRLLGGHGSG